MWKNHLLITLRVLRKNLRYTFINVAGLAIGIAALLIITHYVRFERSYDTQGSAQQYRVMMADITAGNRNAALVPTLAPAMASGLPGVTNTLRLFSQGGLVNIPEATSPTAFSEHVYLYVDSSFFSFFPWPTAQQGHPLGKPYSAAISTTQAIKYFGTEEAVGKVIQVVDMFGEVDYTVTAVFDRPENTQIPYELLLRNTRLFHPDNAGNNIQGWNAFTTYVALAMNADPRQIEAVSEAFIDEAAGEAMGLRLELQPRSGVYLAGEASPQHLGVYGSPSLVKLIALVGIIILALAWINYINLATARAMDRAREVGVRKTMGSGRSQLIGQFLLEAALFNVAAGILGLTLVQLSIHSIEQWVGLDFFPGLTQASASVWGLLAALMVLGTLGSGLYPALVLSRFRPAQVLKGQWKRGQQGVRLRQLLVVAQFATSVVLLGLTVTVFRQVQFMRKSDLGADISRNLVIEAPRMSAARQGQRLDTFEEALASLAAVENITVSNGVPGMGFNYGTNIYRPQDTEREEGQPVKVTMIDHRFLDHFGLELIAGRNYPEAPQTNYEEVILNRKAVESLGLQPAEGIGQRVLLDYASAPVEIIGVVENYHPWTLRAPIPGIALQYTPRGSNFALRLDANQYDEAGIPAVLERVRTLYQTSFPGNPFEYTFLDDRFANLYQEDQRFGQFFALFASIAMFIGCLGLLGLVTFMAMQRTKEVGVRKVLGASGRQVFLLLSRDFLRLIGVAIGVSIPIMGWLNGRWMEEFPFPAPFSVGPYVLPALSVLGLAWITISYQTWRVARTNPVHALRDE